MRWPLALSALLLLGLHAAQSLTGGKSSPWAEATEEARHVFIPFAAACAVFIGYGRVVPGAYYLTWAVLLAQIVQTVARPAGSPKMARCAYWTSLGLVAILWVMQLPLLDRA
ncbi:MAG TPA: hypothetical protein VF678_01040 [bacterium]